MSHSQILQWLLSLTTKIMCEGRPQLGAGPLPMPVATNGRRAYVEYSNGHFELNVFKPLIISNVLRSIRLLGEF